MSAGFTKDAAAAARIQEKRHITLIGLDTLFDLWMEHYGKLTDQALRRLPLRPIGTRSSWRAKRPLLT